MKKQTIKLSMLLCLALISCQKKEIELKEKISYSSDELNESNENGHDELVQRASDLRVFFDNGNIPGVQDVDYGCEGSGGNCHPDVIASPQVLGPLIDVTNPTNPKPIRDRFSQYQEVLVKVLGSESVFKVINGTYDVRHRGNVLTGGVYFTFYQNGASVLTQPVFVKVENIQ